MNRSLHLAATSAAAVVLTLGLAAWATEAAGPGPGRGTGPARGNNAARSASLRAIAPAAQRFDHDDVAEVPDFQKHVLPLMSRMGCNGRACHGSFQGRGGFRLSLFGYDFKADHEALLAKDSGRVDTTTPEASKILQKPTLAIPHKGGKVIDEGTWQYRVLARWLEAGAKGATNPAHFERLEVSPREIVFDGSSKPVTLKVTAHWADGTVEDVTCLSRFRTNDEAVAEVSPEGVVTSKGVGDTHVVAFYDNGVSVVQVLRPVSDKVGPRYPDVPTPTRVDALVVEKLRKLGIVPSDLADDAEFLRRLRIDLTGTIPTPAEVDAFLADGRPSAQKRRAKVDELLTSPEYASWWAAKLCDLSGATPQQFNGMSNNTEIVRNWHTWLARRIGENMPYDQIIAGIVLAASRLPGQGYDDYVKQESAYYRNQKPDDFAARPTMPYFWARRRNFNTPDEKALGFSYTFLGVRLECAQCHKHPFDQWTQDDFKKFTAFFAPVGYGLPPDARKRANELRQELGLNKLMGGQLNRELGRLVREGKTVPWQEVYVSTARPAVAAKKANGKGRPGASPNAPKLLGGEPVDLSKYRDPRRPLMDWMRSKDNPYFARALVNRVWANYFGRGIVHPTDDLNLANPPVNAPLLDYLTNGFVKHGYDLKWLHREIANSQAYQRDWRPNDTNRLDEKNFSHAAVRRLPAEVLIDAVAQVTGPTAELARVGKPEGLDDRAIGPKGFAGGRRGLADYASRVFGRSARDTTCDCAASTEPNLLQSIYLQNDGELLSSIERRGGWVDERTGSAGKAAQAARASEQRLVDQFKARVRELEASLEKARARGPEGEKQVKDLELQLAKRRDDLKLHKKRLAELPAPKTAPPFDAETVVREAYLRTLGRRPTDAELARARAHFQSAGDDTRGFRDLLWALLNTKEFVTNH